MPSPVGAPLGYAPSLFANVRRGLKSFQRANALAYLAKKKSFITLTTGVNAVKLLFADKD